MWGWPFMTFLRLVFSPYTFVFVSIGTRTHFFNIHFFFWSHGGDIIVLFSKLKFTGSG